jgi:stage II sporulation protein D
LPYLHSVFAYDDYIGKKGHGVGMSQYGANNLAKKGYTAYQILNYFYNDVSLGTLKKG